MSSAQNSLVHLIAGGVGGTAGAVVTCPLEVLKTRLQSSTPGFNGEIGSNGSIGQTSAGSGINRTRSGFISNSRYAQTPRILLNVMSHSTASSSQSPQCGCPQGPRMGGQFGNYAIQAKAKIFTDATAAAVSRTSHKSMMDCFRHIVRHEGWSALFKGLGPNLIGVAPSRAIYFWAYSNTKSFLNARTNPNSPLVHMGSAAAAGFSCSTLTNPIWLIKTRLQLDHKVDNQKLSVVRCVKQVYEEAGLRGFFKGISASYVGISETIIHFVIYEKLKSSFLSVLETAEGERSTSVYLCFALSAGCSKMIAATVAYPHEVVRTRLRQEGTNYKGFLNTLLTVCREENWRSLYRGLGVHLFRQIPNTAIMLGTYELIVHKFADNDDLASIDADDD